MEPSFEANLKQKAKEELDSKLAELERMIKEAKDLQLELVDCQDENKEGKAKRKEILGLLGEKMGQIAQFKTDENIFSARTDEFLKTMSLFLRVYPEIIKSSTREKVEKLTA